MAWPDLDLIIVDFPPGTSDLSLTMLQDVVFDGAFVVTSPHTLSVEDASKSSKMILDAGVPIWGVIENMSFYEHAGIKNYLFGKGGGVELKALFNLPALITVPIFSNEDQLFCERMIENLEPCKKIIDKKVLNKNLCMK